MFELLHRAASLSPDAPAVVTARRTTTYGELAAAASGFAAALAARGITRIGLLDDDPAHVIAMQAGASLAGVESCVYPLAATDEAAAGHAERFGHDVVVSSRPGLRALVGGLDPLDLLVPVAVPVTPDLPAARPMLVMTTGTTGAPKAVRNDWSRVLRPVARIRRAPEQRWLLGYGLNQFGGLQLVLHVLAAGATLIVPAPIQPRVGLVLMREHGVTHLSATPTFWRFLLAELRADGGPVPPLVQATLSGEPVPESVLDEVRDTFPDARVTQIYAATEFGPLPGVRDRSNGLPLTALDGDGEVALKVVDGELWVRSSAASLGYLGDDPVDPDAWRPTGDLVEVVGDRVLFRGRTSEVINVGGVKIHPLPVEERIEEVPGVRAVRVFGRPNRMVGAIVAVEVVLADGADPEQVDDAIRAACADLPPAARPRSIRVVDELPVVGGKVVRTTRSAPDLS